MNKSTRRSFIKKSMAAVAGAGIVSSLPASSWSQVSGANDEIRVAIAGVKKQGIQVHIGQFAQIPGVRIVALCDCDTQFFAGADEKLKQYNVNPENVEHYTDIRKMLEDKNIDVVSLPIPDHWHALATVWACQAGKDVYVEKPASWSIWEGRKMVEAARKYARIVQAGSQERSDVGLIEAADFIKQGKLGEVKHLRAISYNNSMRYSLGKAQGPQPVPETCDYDIFQGPAPMHPLMRNTLHYEWHWFWETGTGEIGNLGGHVLDDCRWMTDLSTMPRKAICIGGRFGWDDNGETPNTQIVYYEYDKVPVLYEIRNYGRMGRYKNITFGLIIQCENGYFAGGRGGGWVYDNDDKRVQQFKGDGGATHIANFIQAVRSRKVSDLKADVLEGHISAALCHMGNISYRLGHTDSVEKTIKEIEDNPLLTESFDRCVKYLQQNEIDLNSELFKIGPMLTMDTKNEEFVGEYSNWANMFLKRNYRKPFAVPDVV